MRNNRYLLVKLLLKNDFKKILVWLGCIVGLNLMTAYVYPTVYETQESIIGFANIIANPVMKALLGTNYPVEAFNHAVIFSVEMSLFSAIAIAVMNIYFSVKFTGVAQEDGVIEIVNSKPVSRYTYLTSSVVVIVFLNLIVFVGISLGLIVMNIDGTTVINSIYYGLMLALVGFVFSGIGFVASKLYNNASSSYAFGYMSLVIFYAIRAIGDVVDNRLSLLSPFGWMVRFQVFYKNNVIYLVLLGILSVAMYFLSYYLFKKVDHSSGVINSNYGKRRASRLLKTTYGLIFRLEKVQILVWILCLAPLTAAFGGIFGEMEVFMQLDIVRQFFGDGVNDFAKTIILYLIKLISVFGVIPCVFVVLKLVKEENRKYIDNIYVRNYARSRYLFQHVTFAIVLSFVIQLLILLSLFSTGSEFILDTMSFGKFFELSLSYLPAIWLVIALASLLVALGKDFTKLIWIYFTFVFVSLYLGELLKFPKWLLSLSAFRHVGTGSINMVASIVMIVMSVVLFAISFLLYKKRDLN